jgi:hypothetical protein
MTNVIIFSGLMVAGVWAPELFMQWRDHRAERKAK